MSNDQPHTSISIAVLLLSVLGPFAGQYAMIVVAAIAGAMWPLSSAEPTNRKAGAWFLLRIVATACILSISGAWVLESTYGLPSIHGTSVAAFVIGSLGNGWKSIFAGLGKTIAAILSKIGSKDPSP